MTKTTSLPHKFGPYGGQFVPDTLMSALDELEAAYLALQDDAEFQAELDDLMRTYVGRPTCGRRRSVRGVQRRSPTPGD